MEDNQNTNQALENFKKDSFSIKRCDELIAFYEEKGLHNEALQIALWKAEIMKDKKKSDDASDNLFLFAISYVLLAVAIGVIIWIVAENSSYYNVSRNISITIIISTFAFQLFVLWNLLSAIYKSR